MARLLASNVNATQRQCLRSGLWEMVYVMFSLPFTVVLCAIKMSSSFIASTSVRLLFLSPPMFAFMFEESIYGGRLSSLLLHATKRSVIIIYRCFFIFSGMLVYGCLIIFQFIYNKVCIFNLLRYSAWMVIKKGVPEIFPDTPCIFVSFEVLFLHCLAVAAEELVHATCGVDELCLTCIERVRCVRDFELDKRVCLTFKFYCLLGVAG